MRASRPLALLSGVAAVALATLVVVSPASAATLPEGQRITVAQNTLVIGATAESQAWDVNPATVAGTAVGPSSSAAYPVTGIDVDDDGHGYAIGREAVGSDPRRPTIATFDANTGAFGTPVPIDFGEQFGPSVCTGIDHRPGEYPILVCKLVTDESVISFIVRVDPVTGDYIDDALYGDQGGLEFDSIAREPGTNTLWVFYTDFDAQVHGAAPFDLATNEFLAEGVLTPMEVRAADFDSNGQLFASVLADDAVVETLATVNLSSGETTVVGDYPFMELSDSVESNVSSLTVWGKPALAATGYGSELVLPVSVGSALLLLAGAAFIATARMGRRAS